MKIAMGIYDAPLIQKQPPFYYYPLKTNLAVFGSPMSGKTTFIKSYLVRIHENREYASQENIYIIDFGGNISKYGNLECVCACFDNSNEEYIKRVFKTLERRLEENTKALDGRNYYSLYAESPSDCPTHLTLIIENLNAFLTDERYASYQDRLMGLCRDGLSKGLSVIVTANDTAGTNRLLSYFGQKIAFEMPSDSYVEIFNTKVNNPMRIPGRGIVNIESATYEVQCFMPFIEKENDELAALISESSAINNPNKLAKFNGDLTLNDISALNPTALSNKSPDEILIGLDYDEHNPVYLDVKNNRAIAIYGKRQFGKTNLLRLILHSLRESDRVERFVFLDDGRKQLEEFKNFGPESVFLTGVESFRDYLYDNGYGGRPSFRKVGANQRAPEILPSNDTPFTVFVLQSKALYQASSDASYLVKEWFPIMIGNAEEKKYLFIFSDVKNLSSPEARNPFNTGIQVAFLLDNIGEFVADKGSHSVFGERDAKELKAEYAKCSKGDGYYYDIEGDILKKLKFIRKD